jgi:beta-N-acetylhexosaminidase
VAAFRRFNRAARTSEAQQRPGVLFSGLIAAMSVYARRRLTAVLIAAAATAVVWAALLRGGGEGTPQSEPARGVSEQVADLVRGLSPPERVDQVLLLGYDGTQATGAIVGELRRHDLGGVLLDSRNFADFEQLAGLTRILRTVSLSGDDREAEGERIPPLIVAPQEGGAYRAFATLPPAETQLEIGDSGSVTGAEEWAREAGEALRAAGVDLALMPVADVATLDSPIADRSFSDDPAIAAELTAAAVRGCHAARIACAALHFPGLGAVSQDTDEGPATVTLDAAGLSERDLEAFRAAFAQRVDAVVISHAFYAVYDPVTPASLAAPVATALLRDEHRFAGVAITDDLGAGAIKSSYSVPDAAVAALQAGADLLRIDSPRDQGGVREALLEAVESEAIADERLAEAAGRVLELKRSQGLLRLP